MRLGEVTEPTGGIWDVPKMVAAVGGAVLVVGIAAFVLTKPRKKALGGLKHKRRKSRR
jgi:hypothetical protein